MYDKATIATCIPKQVRVEEATTVHIRTHYCSSKKWTSKRKSSSSYHCTDQKSSTVVFGNTGHYINSTDTDGCTDWSTWARRTTYSTTSIYYCVGQVTAISCCCVSFRIGTSRPEAMIQYDLLTEHLDDQIFPRSMIMSITRKGNATTSPSQSWASE